MARPNQVQMSTRSWTKCPLCSSQHYYRHCCLCNSNKKVTDDGASFFCTLHDQHLPLCRGPSGPGRAVRAIIINWQQHQQVGCRLHAHALLAPVGVGRSTACHAWHVAAAGTQASSPG